MKINEIRCKSCGAHIKINEGDKTVTCKYCNNTYTVENEKNKNEYTSKSKYISDPKLLIVFIAVPVALVTLYIIIATSFSFRNRTNMKNTVQINNTSSSTETNQSNAKNKVSKFSFNAGYHNGTMFGASAWSILDRAITNNKTNSEKIVSVKYNDIKTSETEGILEIKRKLGEFKNYEVVLDYDNDGYVNCITILDI